MRRARGASSRGRPKPERRNNERAGRALPLGDSPEQVFAPIGRRVVLVFAGVLLALLAPWPRYGRVFAGGFSAYANGTVWVLSLGGGAQPKFAIPTAAEREDPDVDDWTVMLSSTVAAERGGQGMPLGTRILGYTPFAIFVALIAATAVPARRRLAITVIGVAILFARLGVAIALPVARAVGQLGANSGFGLAAEVAWGSFIDQPALSYVTPLFAWGVGLLVTASPSSNSIHRKSEASSENR